MATNKTEIIDKGYKRLREQIDELDGSSVSVGFFSGQTGGGDIGGAETATIPEYMYYNEVGTEDTPARPLMGATFEKYQDGIESRIADGIEAIEAGKTRIKSVLRDIGVSYERLLKEEQTEWSEPPNAEATIEQKGVDNPLIEHGTARNAISHKINE